MASGSNVSNQVPRSTCMPCQELSRYNSTSAVKLAIAVDHTAPYNPKRGSSTIWQATLVNRPTNSGRLASPARSAHHK